MGIDPIRKPDFETAVARIKAIRDTEGPELHPLAKTRLFSHGKKTNTAVLWFHGYSTCPQQFVPLGEICFERGMNVYIPLAPCHGINDPLSKETLKLSEAGLKEYAAQSLALACGLGENVIVGGLSMGGAITLWLAQRHAEIKRAIVIAPAIGYRSIPAPFLRPVVTAIGILPDRMHWWDAEKKLADHHPEYTYAWVSMHGLAIFPRLGLEVRKLNKTNPPAAVEVWMVINDHDEAVDTAYVQKVALELKKTKGDGLKIYHFPDELGLIHNCVSEELPQEKLDLVYPVLMDIIEGKGKES